MSHLAGPWKIVEREVLEDGSIYPAHVVTENGEYLICYLEHRCPRTIHRLVSNAILAAERNIVAAPDLLKALETIVNCASEYLHMNFDDYVLDDAKAAIAKARGEKV